jgi:site-specific DNA-methyltransferase (adenine-specific)
MIFPAELQNSKAWASLDDRSMLLAGECIAVMDQLIDANPDGCFEMIFADPPYFLSSGGITCQSGKMVAVDKGNWDKSVSIEEVHSFNLLWLERCKRLLKKNGSIWVSGTHHNIHSVGLSLRILGFKVLNDITWEKPNPPPNLGCRNFTHSTETLLWASKDAKAKHTFNYALMKSLNDGKQMKSVWRLPSAAKSEKLHGRHPTQKPLALLERCIASASSVGETIFDPFAGSSSTGVAAISLGRHYCGIELDTTFVDLSIKRLSAVLEKK